MEEQVEQSYTKLDDLLIDFQVKCDGDLGIYILVHCACITQTQRTFQNICAICLSNIS